MDDREYMMRALALARRGEGWTAPNPMVGAVIVKDGHIIGEGWHEKCGELHAERNALKHCSEDPRGADMYVTLEPCCHQGRQPPCTDAILAAGIARVFVGSDDPNPLAAGKGIEILRTHGVKVFTHICKEECDRLNEVFFHYITTKRPYVVMKYAMTMDGKIAAYTGKSRWITGEEARAHVQKLRHRYTAIMAGVGTVLADDPLLTCRLEGGKNPVRIICDSRLRTPEGAKIIQTAQKVPVIIAACSLDPKAQSFYQAAGCRILLTDPKDGHVNLIQLMEQLGAMEIDSILLEGGGTLNWAALECGIVNKVLTYISPKLLGGKDAKTPVEGRGAPDPDTAVFLESTNIIRLGEDFLIESEVKRNVHWNR